MAGMLAFKDTFWMLNMVTAVMVLMTLLLRSGRTDGKQAVLL